jgi:hypothetical protein
MEYSRTETLSDGRPGRDPVEVEYEITQMPHVIIVDFKGLGKNHKVEIEGWDGKVTAKIWNGDTLPESVVEMRDHGWSDRRC